MIHVIALNTFREAIRDRIWIILIAFGVALLAGSQIVTPIALGEGARVTVDIGLSTLGLVGMIMAIVVGGNMVHQEIDRRSIHIVLARPVSRTTYLIGKWLGLSGMLWGAGLLMGAALLGVAWLARGPEVFLPLVQAVVLTCCSFGILSSLAILFSSMSTPVLSSLYSLGVYALGWWALDLRNLGEKLGEPIGTMLSLASYLLPNLEIFNARAAVAHLEPVPGVQVVVALAYAACYSTAVLALAAIAFYQREFK